MNTVCRAIRAVAGSHLSGPRQLRFNASTLAVGLLAAIPLRADRGAEPQYAPPEAYLPGEKLPYFGSENPWDRRFFTKEKPPRVGQPQILLLQEGKIDEAIALCRERLAEDAAEVESHLVLAYAHARRGALKEAEDSLATALALGLPPERLLAGPRSLAQPLQQTATYRRVRDASSGLLHGPLLGAVSPNSIRVWVRTLEESEVEIRASRHGDFEQPDARATVRSRSGDDFTAVVELKGLSAATRYTYSVRIDGRMVPSAPEWTFRTAPEPASRARVRVAFGGCARYWPPYERVWDAIRASQPDAFLLLGDNVYLDLPETVGPFHDYTYYQRQSRPEFRRLVASVPVYAIWDDHDAGIDDIFLGPFPDKPAWKVQHYQLFNRNWNNPSHGAEPEWPGLWHSVRLGAAEFFMLDGRYYRENFLKPQPSMLGSVQKKWLLQALERSTATFKLLVSPVAWADDAKIDNDPKGGKILAKDTWAGFPAERQEIYDFIAAKNISGVVLLSGDRHRADFRINQRPRGYPLQELMCSWLTNSRSGADLVGNTVWAYNDQPTFAQLTIDAERPDPTLTMDVYNIDVQPVFHRVIPLSTLRDR